MNSSDLRRRFLAFFEKKNHTVVPSDSLVPANDPTLLFTGAGMNQFKDYFLGFRKELKRAATCQKCFRTGDVGEVGQTPSHLTFFEMLGNFSFGDYFKKEAIAWAWEFMTKDLEISPDRLWATVYRDDDEAAQIWRSQIGLPPERIVRFGAKENFWPSNAPTDGPNGPCGPCSELHYDYNRCRLGKTCPDPDRCAPGCPCGRFVEVWNLVFTQFNRQPDGRLIDLPAKNIDTGMGLERLAAVTQDKMSVFETDLFEPIIDGVVHLLREEAPFVLKLDQRAAIYAIADHLRALTFLIAEGVIPSNEGRGYVVRMLLRKAERAGIGVGFPRPFLYRLVPIVTKIMEAAYPELVTRRESIAKVIQAEEERFRQTLEEKMPLLEEHLKGRRALSAEEAARFYDTHGLGYEEMMSASKRVGVPPPSRGDFEKALAGLQAKSKASTSFSGAIFARDALTELVAGIKPTEFVGYAALSSPARVVGLIQGDRLVSEAQAPALVVAILDRSPFYGEQGGQVGDAGILAGAQGELKVTDTQWVGNILAHKAELTAGKIRVNDPVAATVDQQRRRRVAQNHTATHLLHAALRRVLGGHVVQAGSLVAPDRLRFDFSHSGALSPAQRDSVESLVNEWIEKALGVSVAQMPLEEAKRAGAVALFGEKYASQVRVVSIGEVSKELCGGTHLPSSGEVGLLTLVEEGSVAAGIRRVEALSGQRAFTFLKSGTSRLGDLAQRLKAPPDKVGEAVDRLLEKIKEQEDWIRILEGRDALGRVEDLIKGKVEISLFVFVGERLPEALSHESLRNLADQIKKKEGHAVIFLSDQNGYCIASCTQEAQKGGARADHLMKLATEIAGGSGGGRPDLAQGKIQDITKFPEIQERIKDFLSKNVQSHS